MIGIKRLCVLALFFPLTWAAATRGQDAAAPVPANSDGAPTSRLNTGSVAAEFVPTTDHYFLGQSEDRRFFAIGGEYARRIYQGRIAHVFYVAELRPVILEGDPVLEGLKNPLTGQVLAQFPDPQRVVFVSHAPTELNPQNITVVPFYGREWTYGASVSPAGTRVNFLPRHRWQPFLETSVGVHLTARDVPVAGARSFNFTLQAGTGVERYLQEGRSLRYEFLPAYLERLHGSHEPWSRRSDGSCGLFVRALTEGGEQPSAGNRERLPKLASDKPV